MASACHAVKRLSGTSARRRYAGFPAPDTGPGVWYACQVVYQPAQDERYRGTYMAMAQYTARMTVAVALLLVLAGCLLPISLRES